MKPQAGIFRDMWGQGRILRVDGIAFCEGRFIRFQSPEKADGLASAKELNPTSVDITSQMIEGLTWAPIEETCSLEMEDVNLRLASGKGIGEGSGYVAAEEFPSRKLIWVAHFSFSRPFITVKFGDDSLIADTTGYREWKFPLRKPETFSVGPSEISQDIGESEAEALFRERYPVLHNFMETTLWPDVDSFNPIELLHKIVYYGDSGRSKSLIEELRSLHADEDIGNMDISGLFNKAEAGHPYEVVNPGNAKDFCYSISESLQFILSLKTNAK